MSATNRGAKREAADFYPTPKEAFDPIVPYLDTDRHHWECAQGDGRLVKWMREREIKVDGSDLASGDDFLMEEINKHGSTIITNPPFSLAQEFIERALELSTEVWMLLRINFLGGQKRHQWWQQHAPNALFVLSERPDFTGAGGDACEYAWFYWGERWRGIIHPDMSPGAMKKYHVPR